MQTFIKMIYYKVYTILATQPWIQLILKLLMYYLLLYIMIYVGKPPSAPSSEDIDIYKELLAEYRLYLETTNIETLQDFINSVDFVIEEFESIDIWSPTLEIITKDDNQANLYVQKQALLLPQLTEEEKVLHFNYLSTILTYDYTQLPNKVKDNFNDIEYFQTMKETLMTEATEILKEHDKVIETNASLLLLYSIMAIGGTLVICVSTYV